MYILSSPGGTDTIRGPREHIASTTGVKPVAERLGQRLSDKRRLVGVDEMDHSPRNHATHGRTRRSGTEATCRGPYIAAIPETFGDLITLPVREGRRWPEGGAWSSTCRCT